MRVRLVAMAAAVLVVAACQRKGPKTPVGAKVTDADTAEQVLYGVTTVMTGKGVRRGDLVADTTYVFNDQTRFLFSNPKATFTKETGQKNGDLKADRGLYDLRTQILEGWGNVVITTTDGKRLESPHLKYDQVANSVTSDTSFVLTDGDKRQEGVGFKSDPNLTVFSCLRACRGSGIFSIPAQ